VIELVQPFYCIKPLSVNDAYFIIFPVHQAQSYDLCDAQVNADSPALVNAAAAYQQRS
jgi:hypothetical protein